MAGELANLSALAFKTKTAGSAWSAPSSTLDITTVANLGWTPNAQTADNPEYTGTIHRNGPIVLGASYDVTFDVILRGPGGTNPPAADAFMIGRILRTLGFTENILSAAIPVAPEALGGGSTATVATLGATAAATADLYKGLALHLASTGSAPTGFTMIRSYSAAKAAGLAETLGGAPTGNYQIPKQLAYTLSATGTPPVLDMSLWQGTTRYDFIDMAPTRAVITFPTSSRDSTEYPRISLTYSGDAYADATDTCPTVSSALAIPPFRGGKLHIAGVAMGGSSVSIDLGLRAGFAPNPNKTSGSDPGQLVETRRSMTLDLNKVAKSYLDMLALARAQSYSPIQGLYGFGSGNYIGFVATDARFNFPSNQAGADFHTTTGEVYVDDANKGISLVFPYW